MQIDPEVKKSLTEVPFELPETLTPELIEEIRGKGSSRFPVLVKEPIESVKNYIISGPYGEIPIRIYISNVNHKNIPALIFFHGGGWVFGNIEGRDAECRKLANALNSIIISVGYRLAPEHRFPIGLEDCYTATEWVFDQSKAFGIDKNQISISGDSAGANLAAGVTHMAKDRKGPKIHRQVLIYPVTDILQSIDHSPYNSIRENEKAPVLTSQMMKSFWDHYILREKDKENSYASVIRAENFTELPPAFIITAEYDPLRDEGEVYAKRLKENGVPVKLNRYEGMVHGFFSLPISINKQVIQSIKEFL